MTCLHNGWVVMHPAIGGGSTDRARVNLEVLAAAATVAVTLLEKDGHDVESDALTDAVRRVVMGQPFNVNGR